MEAGHLRENPQTPQLHKKQLEQSPNAARLMGLLLAANNQATRRNKRNNKKLTSIEFKHPACLNKKQNHRRNSLLASTDRFLVPENILHTGFTEKGSL